MNQVLEICESTNDIARLLADQGAPHGTWISARAQTRGRGRSGRSWISDQGGLYLSIVARMPTQALSWLPIAAGIGSAQAIEELNAPCGRVKLKWPNDLWTARGKIGGILCEGLTSAHGHSVVIGIGINGMSAPMGDEIQADCTGLDPDRLRPAVIDRVLQVLQSLTQEGVGSVSDRYQSRALLAPGKTVKWQSGARKGEVVGLGPSGELVVRTESGEHESLFAEDVKLSAF